MRQYLLPVALPAAAMLMLTGCMDKDYDLDNLDKTVGVSVNDLVIPVNVGDITLNSVFDLDKSETETITKEEYTGSDENLIGKQIYVFNKTGDFTSDPIHIAAFAVHPSQPEPSHSKATTKDITISERRRAASAPIKYNIRPIEKKFNYTVTDVDSKVKTVDAIESPNMEMNIVMNIDQEFSADVENITLNDIWFQFPKGMQGVTVNLGGVYDPKTGKVHIESYNAGKNTQIKLTIKPQIFTFSNSDKENKVNNGRFTISDDMTLLSGQVLITPIQGRLLDEEFDFDTSYDLTPFDISYFTGKIDYDIDGLNFDEISLNDMPEFLQGDQTNIVIDEPQLYITIYNTVCQYHLGGDVKLDLTAKRPGGDRLFDGCPLLQIGWQRDNKAAQQWKFAITPVDNFSIPNVDVLDHQSDLYKNLSSYYSAQQNGTLQTLKWDNFSQVIAGNDEVGYGIPTAVDVDFVDPQMNGTATRFPLRLPSGSTAESEIPAVHGDYLFRAPLALADGSVIVYNKEDGNWDSDELEHLDVNSFSITANAYSDIPLSVSLSGWLLKKKLDSNGNPIVKTDEYGNPERNDDGEIQYVMERIGKCEPAEIPANANGTEMTLTVTPEGNEPMSGVDGIYYEAIAKSDINNGPALSPQMAIQLKNLRAKVSGMYVKDLDD